MRPGCLCASDAAPFPVSHDTSIIYLGRTHFHLRFYRGCQIGIFELALGPLGPKKQPKGPYWGHPQEKQNRRPQSHRNFLRFTLWIFRIHQRSGNGVSSSGLRPLSAVFQNAFRLGHPQNWPESPFRSSNPTIIWEKGNLGIFQIDA